MRVLHMFPMHMLLMHDTYLLTHVALNVARRGEAIVCDGYKTSVEVETKDEGLAYVSNVHVLDM